MEATLEKPDNYNGWANRETWAYMLWLQNDPGIYDSVFEMLREMKRTGQHITDTWSKEMGGEILDGLWDAVASGRDASGYQDGSSNAARNCIDDIGSVWRIDWREVARHFNEWMDEADA